MMTPERKNQLLRVMASWIRQEMDPRGNERGEVFVALHTGCGMTEEELHELGINDLDAFFKGDLKTQFKEKVNRCFEEYRENWSKLTPDELITRSEEISTIRKLAKELPDMVSGEDLEYLNRFKNPLEVAEDICAGSIFSDIDEQDFSHILWESRERNNLEDTFEVEETPIRSEAHQVEKRPSRKGKDRDDGR